MRSRRRTLPSAWTKSLCNVKPYGRTSITVRSVSRGMTSESYLEREGRRKRWQRQKDRREAGVSSRCGCGHPLPRLRRRSKSRPTEGRMEERERAVGGERNSDSDSEHRTQRDRPRALAILSPRPASISRDPSDDHHRPGAPLSRLSSQPANI